MLLIKSTTKVTLEKRAPKVIAFCPVLNGYLYTATVIGEPYEKLVHIDHSGKVLWEKSYPDSVDTFGMFSEREAIAMSVTAGQIDVIDLLEHTVRSYPHQYAFDDTSSMQILLFNDTRVFCILEKGTQSDARFFLTYYAFEANNVKLVQPFKSEKGQWSYDQQIAKVNNHSKVAWWKPLHEGNVEFLTFSLQENFTGLLRDVRVNITIGPDYRLNKFTMEIGYLWETAPDVFLLVCNTNREVKKEEKQAPNNNYILDVRKEIIRETKFSFPDRWNAKLVDCFSLGEVSVFHTFYHQNGKPVASPVFYVHNERQEIISREESNSGSTSEVNYYVPGFDSSTIIEAKHQNGDVDSVEVTTKRLMTPKEMYLHFMLHINEDFDDDLLQDAVELLTQQ